MKYLFFDLEFATSRAGISKICEFGYVLTNELFDVIKRENLIIDPYIARRDWDYRVVKKILTRSIKEYESNPRFDEYYDQIYDLINTSDYVFGHTISSDVKALNQDIKRYNLNPIDFKFYDVKEIYRNYSNIKKDRSVTNILTDLHINGEDNTHDAETDAYNTMLILKNMLNSLEMNLNDLLELVPNALDNTNNFVIKSIDESNKRKIKRYNSKIESPIESNNTRRRNNWFKYTQFIDNVKPNGKLGSVFKDKKVSISINYEENHFKQMLNLIQLIVNNGGTVILKATLSDIFVKYDIVQEDGTLRYDSKLKYVLEANDNGSNIEIIDFYELLNRLNITEKELDDMPMPSFDFLLNKDSIIKDPKDKKLKDSIQINYNEESNCTLGKLFPDVFKNLLKEIEED